MKLAERKPHRLLRELTSRGYSERQAHGSHHLVRCRCGRAAAVVPLRERDLSKGTLGRIGRLLACNCMEVADD